jgi:hypothetical protein
LCRCLERNDGKSENKAKAKDSRFLLLRDGMTIKDVSIQEDDEARRSLARSLSADGIHWRGKFSGNRFKTEG